MLIKPTLGGKKQNSTTISHRQKVFWFVFVLFAVASLSCHFRILILGEVPVSFQPRPSQNLLQRVTIKFIMSYRCCPPSCPVHV